VLAAIEIPVLSEGARWGYHKVCRKTGEFAQAIGAVVLDPARGLARVVCGAVEAPPILLEAAGAALLGGGLAPALAAAREEIQARLARHGGAFEQLHRVAVERALTQAVQP
jgi:carbon-monoxide dehydrogenase medium subunit